MAIAITSPQYRALLLRGTTLLSYDDDNDEEITRVHAGERGEWAVSHARNVLRGQKFETTAFLFAYLHSTYFYYDQK